MAYMKKKIPNLYFTRKGFWIVSQATMGFMRKVQQNHVFICVCAHVPSYCEVKYSLMHIKTRWNAICLRNMQLTTIFSILQL